MTEYTSRPKIGNGRKAWDKFVKQWNEEPAAVYYTPCYDFQYKGWVCEWNITDPRIKHMNYGGSSCYTFYMISELNDE